MYQKNQKDVEAEAHSNWWQSCDSLVTVDGLYKTAADEETTFNEKTHNLLV